jgi:ABC-type nitrate/sulfonate/bicarbonate transport system permease component
MRLLGQFALRYWGVALILLFWQGWVMAFDLNAIVLPRPAAVLRDILAHPGLYLANAAVTGWTAASGLALGMAAGTLLAILGWSSALAGGMLTPIGVLFSSIPVVALIPVLARLFGYEGGTAIAIVAIISFLPAFVFTSSGLRALPPGSDDVFRVFGSGGWRRFSLLVLPSAVPSWMIALRLAAPTAILAALLAEYLIGTSGLGYLFRAAGETFDTERALGTSVVATIVSLLLFAASLSAEAFIRRRWE